MKTFLSKNSVSLKHLATTFFLISLLVTIYQLLAFYEDKKLTTRILSLAENHGISALPPPDFLDSPELVQLGEFLFFDKLLSGNKNISCATCHHPTLSAADASSLSIGEGGQGLGQDRKLLSAQTTLRNAPSLFNLGYKNIPSLFWDGRIEFNPEPKTIRAPAREINTLTGQFSAKLVHEIDSALEAQVLMPMTDFAEMRGKIGENELADAPTRGEVWILILGRLLGVDTNASDPVHIEYRKLFQAAYPTKQIPNEVLATDLGRALAAFIRQTFVANNTPWDRFLRGDRAALSASAKRGALIFLKPNSCVSCHAGPHLSRFEYASLAVPQIGPGNVMTAWDEGGTYTRGISQNTTDDFGRYTVTFKDSDRFLFRVPPLRQVATSGPWMHNGAFTDLSRVLTHLDDPARSLSQYQGEGINKKEFLANLQKNKKMDQDRLKALDLRISKLPKLNAQEQEDLLSFLREALTDTEAIEKVRLRIPKSVPSGIDLRD